jgi:hypothetical protein
VAVNEENMTYGVGEVIVVNASPVISKLCWPSKAERVRYKILIDKVQYSVFRNVPGGVGVKVKGVTRSLCTRFSASGRCVSVGESAGKSEGLSGETPIVQAFCQPICGTSVK